MQRISTVAVALITLISMTAMVLVASLPLTPRAEAAGYANYYSSYYPYNFMFTLNGQPRQIRSHADLHQLLQDLAVLLSAISDQLGEINDDDGNEDTDSEVDVVTRSAIRVEDDHARMRGEVVDFGSSDFATVWFEYGRSSGLLTQQTNTARIDEDEDGEFEGVISNLTEGARYYFRAVARDDDGERDYGSTLNFVAGVESDDEEDEDDDRNGDIPDVITDHAEDVDDTSATLAGSVDMNDFEDGDVFFVYGEDEDMIEDVMDDFDTYRDVDEDGDNLQKVLVDTGLDDEDDYELTISGLNEDTDYYFSLCVAYEDEDDDEVIECGEVRDFTTDEN